MKVISYGYNPKTRIGFIKYKSNFIQRLFGIKEICKEWKRSFKWPISNGYIWINLISEEAEHQKLLDCAVDLCDI